MPKYFKIFGSLARSFCNRFGRSHISDINCLSGFMLRTRLCRRDNNQEISSWTRWWEKEAVQTEVASTLPPLPLPRPQLQQLSQLHSQLHGAQSA